MSKFTFTVGPWNVHEGAETFGPGVRPSVSLEEKIQNFARIGIHGVQFHDDDAVPGINELSEKEIVEKALEVRKMLDKHGLFAEFVAPRLWFDRRTSDGAYTAGREEDYEFAIWRTLRSVDIARALGTDKVQLWLAREGTLCAEAKNPVEKIRRLKDAMDEVLRYDPGIRILIEPKPNEPVDRSYCGTVGHALTVGGQTIDPDRVGVCVESAHSIMAGLDPANDMALALAFDKLWGVHLNDQNGVRFDQDKSFGVENLRQAFNQVKVLHENNFGEKGECVGLDVKAMRTQGPEDCYRHIQNSMRIFNLLLEKVKRFDYDFQARCVREQNYEKLEMYVLELLMGV